MKTARNRLILLNSLAVLFCVAFIGLPARAADMPDSIRPQVADAWYNDYHFRDGETLNRLHIHYATVGNPHRDSAGNIDNAVLLLHWTASSGAALLSPAYIKSLYSPGAPLDSSKYFLIIPDNVGHGQSSKPSDELKSQFPHYGYGDLVDIQHKLVTETLGIKHLRAIVGMSMGGMNAWQWAETYPDEMDGVMSVVALPIKVSGRNKLWRQMAINDIQADPEWDGGDYTSTPSGLLKAGELIAMMIDGVPHLQKEIPDSQAAQGFIEETDKRMSHADANDMLYSLTSSNDYDPEPGLASIKTQVFVLDFDDDEFNPVSLRVLERVMPRVKHGRFVIQPGTEDSYGHLTMAHPELWAAHVGELMAKLP